LNESENSIIITRADKGNLSCILNKEQYEEIANQLLSDVETYRPLDVDPTKRLTHRVKNFFLKKFLDLGVIDKKTFYRLTPSATNAPRIYFLPKLHKMKSPTDKLQARPVVSTINSPLCSLSKIITETLTKAFKSKYAVKNSFEFVDKLKKVKVPAGYTLISLDVQSLFTSIPRYVFMDCVEKNWDSIKQHTTIPKELFMNALAFIINNSYFTYNNQTYVFINGLPMGLDLSCIASAYVMEHVIDLVMTEIDHHIEMISLYVDDTFIIINQPWPTRGPWAACGP
jgi:hypothetical protein